MKGSRWAAGVLVAALGCGGGGLGEEGNPLAATLQPLAVGSSWTYRSSKADGSQPDEKTTTVVRREEVNGIDAAVFETRRGDKVSQVWLGELDGRILRLREETREPNVPPELRRFEPGSLRTPATLDGIRVGQVLPSEYVEIFLFEDGEERFRVSRAPVWKVEAVGEEVETPAGRFGAIRLLRTGNDDDGTSEKRIWYAPGVGKVREQGARLEELIRYQIGEE
jgi:hypothetical protein